MTMATTSRLDVELDAKECTGSPTAHGSAGSSGAPADEPSALSGAAPLARQARLPTVRSRPCFSAGLLLAAILLVASADHYMWNLRVERAQLTEDLRTAERARAEMAQRMRVLQNRLMRAERRARVECVPTSQPRAAEHTPDGQSVDSEERRTDIATRTRANRHPIGSPPTDSQ